MKCTHKDLEFLSVFKKRISKKFNCLKIEGTLDKTIFTHIDDTNVFVYTLNIGNEENFIIYIDAEKFLNLYKNIKKTEEIVINKELITFGKSKYKHTILNEEFDIDYYYENLHNSQNFTLKNLSKAEIINKSIKSIEDLNVIALQKNHYVATDGLIVYIFDANININFDLYISDTVYDIFKDIGIDTSIDLKFCDNKYIYFTYNNYECFSNMITNSALPDLFDEDMKQLYDNKDEIHLEKEALFSALERLSTVLTNEDMYKVCLTIKDKVVILSNTNSNECTEEIETIYCDKLLNNLSYYFSANPLIKALKNLQYTKIILYLDHTENTNSITITEFNKNTTDKLILSQLD